MRDDCITATHTEAMHTLLRALLLRNRYCAPVGADGELPGGGASEDGADDDQQEDQTAGDEEADEAVSAEADDEGGDEPAAESDDLVITLEGQDLPADEGDDLDDIPANVAPKASAAFAKMRADKKRLERENRELKAAKEESAQRTAQPAAIEPLGDEPTMEGCDYDAEAYAGQLKSYLTRKAEHETRAAQHQEAQRKEQEAWTNRLASYKQEAAKLKRPDFEDAESAVKNTFSVTQQGLLLKHPKGAALVYVLGKNPARAKTLAAIADPVDFAYAAADLAGQVKVERKSPPPPTDTPVRGRTTGAALASQGLASLKEQAQRTGNYDAYFKAKRAADARKAVAA